MKERDVERIIDANLNRASEGLRVLEDIIRFTYNNKKISLLIKNQRHQLRNLFNEEVKELIAARDAKGDVGRDFLTLSKKIKSIEDLAIRNIKRVEESLRSLEEITKLYNKNKIQKLQQMRFYFYSIEKDIYRLIYSKKKLRKTGIYVVLPDWKAKETLNLVRKIIDCPVSAIQLRSKNLPDSEIIKIAHSIRTITAKNNIQFIVNDRPDIALAVCADGVHIGQDDIPLKEVRKLVGFEFIVGVSTNSILEAKKAAREGADYVAYGSIFPTVSKRNVVVKGLNKLQAFCKKVELPVVAIGGINEKNIEEVSAAGASYAAVISCISNAKDPAKIIRKLYRNFIKGKKKRVIK